MTEVVMCCENSREIISPEEERVSIRDIALAAETNTKEGDTFYLINQNWWQQWIEYVNDRKHNNGETSEQFGTFNGSKRPSAINNSDLISDPLSEDSEVDGIRDALLEGRDYILLPQAVWERLYSWYGGGPTIPRKVISSGLPQSELFVEVYPLRLQLKVLPRDYHYTIQISKRETIGDLYARARDILDVGSDQVYIWDYYGCRKHALLNEMAKTLDDASIQMDQDILVETVNANSSATAYNSGAFQNGGSFATECCSGNLELSKSSFSTAGGFPACKGIPRSCGAEASQGQTMLSPSNEIDTLHVANNVCTRGSLSGLVGLMNLGNTCFMNSAIQCLVHTPEFAKYFQEDFHQEINLQNPLGMVGELAVAFGDLLRKLWTPGRTPVSPRPFKMKLARFAPQFSGYNQHDSQELLAFLLDGLHEDLNRVSHKPYIKSRDADGRPDEDIADEYWANHVARNDSIIVDVCQGQFKSTLVCPTCSKVSVTFDPFMYLSLPLQSTNTRFMTVTVFSSNKGMPPTPFTVSVLRQGRCRDLVLALSSAASLQNNEELKLAEIRNHLFHQFLDDPFLPLSSIKDEDHLAAYKIPKSEKRRVFLHLIHHFQTQNEAGPTIASQGVPYGTPLLASISLDNDNTTTKTDIKSAIKASLSPILMTSSHGYTGPDSPIFSRLSDTPKFCLRLEDGSNLPLDLSGGDDDEVVQISSSLKLVVDIIWSADLICVYNMNRLEYLPEVVKHGLVNKKARTEPPSLYSCFEAFLREEPLVPEEMWYCAQCKERRQAIKKLDLWRLPNVLVIHLKRFSYSKSMKHKLEMFVDFPIHDLDLTTYVANKNNMQCQLYDLYALINHYGSMGSGHYTANIKLLDENRWYNFDDSHVSPISEDDVKSAAAYVLFYLRIPGAGPTNTNPVCA